MHLRACACAGVHVERATPLPVSRGARTHLLPAWGSPSGPHLPHPSLESASTSENTDQGRRRQHGSQSQSLEDGPVYLHGTRLSLTVPHPPRANPRVVNWSCRHERPDWRCAHSQKPNIDFQLSFNFPPVFICSFHFSPNRLGAGRGVRAVTDGV